MREQGWIFEGAVDGKRSMFGTFLGFVLRMGCGGGGRGKVY